MTIAREIRNINANLVAMYTKILILSYFLTMALQHVITNTPNADIAKLKNGLKQFDALSFKETLESFLPSTSPSCSMASRVTMPQNN